MIRSPATPVEKKAKILEEKLIDLDAVAEEPKPEEAGKGKEKEKLTVKVAKVEVPEPPKHWVLSLKRLLDR